MLVTIHDTEHVSGDSFTDSGRHKVYNNMNEYPNTNVVNISTYKQGTNHILLSDGTDSYENQMLTQWVAVRQSTNNYSTVYKWMRTI